MVSKLERDSTKLFHMLIFKQDAKVLYYVKDRVYANKVLVEVRRMLVNYGFIYTYDHAHGKLTTNGSTVCVVSTQERCHGVAWTAAFVDELSSIDVNQLKRFIR